MASLKPNAKRRRLDHASSAAALSKPFKSPLRRQPEESKGENAPLKKEESALLSSNAINQAARTSSHLSQNPSPKPSSFVPDSLSTNSLATPSSPFRKMRTPGERLTFSMRPILPDPAVLNLQKQQRVLQSRLAALRSELETVQQALQIESSNRDDELEALIVKWRRVSQNAADEVFTGAQERVSRMGGIKAWRERMKNDSARWEQEEMESWFGNVDVEGADLDEDELQARKADIMGEIDEIKEGLGGEAKEPEDFTMDFMLKTLNIDLRTIGYDQLNQKWTNG
ncbi:hypothetical protein P175DRAFT_0454203 [Aspergillus ochraceoroseus IBT 24754]|uniref:DNA repair protein Dds20/Sfr1 n=1 Tax=Aspergillus ochraceoroseus IBT 24754 TaxID=1392256 RepID=A0A2T5M390_9EURO|nr:uncharacterized protein P175DRAFT_0454203 [Aspergillus ochraceoroseus IBT 24754]PTU22993.1 hypothetical protein P175DRAFT_0454203 [Aspergillus ochraceoroseus IBT 24754]